MEKEDDDEEEEKTREYTLTSLDLCRVSIFLQERDSIFDYFRFDYFRLYFQAAENRLLIELVAKLRASHGSIGAALVELMFVGSLFNILTSSQSQRV